MSIKNIARFKTLLISTAILCLFVLRPGAADKPRPGETSTESRLWLTGDSSLHKYSSTAHNMEAKFGLAPGQRPFDQLKAGALTSLSIRIPVNDMRSGKDGLDKNLAKTLKAGEHPNILFDLTTYEVLASTSQAVTPVRATGTLEIAGMKKNVEVEGTLEQDGAGARLQGSKDLLMTDFGIKPPKILLIKTANEVTVHYDLRVDENGSLK